MLVFKQLYLCLHFLYVTNLDIHFFTLALINIKYNAECHNIKKIHTAVWITNDIYVQLIFVQIYVDKGIMKRPNVGSSNLEAILSPRLSAIQFS